MTLTVLRRECAGRDWRSPKWLHFCIDRFAMTDDSADVAAENAPEAPAESQDAIRERVTRLAFGANPKKFDEFIRVLDEATPDGVDVILRGSSVTGHKWGSDEPFDAEGPGTSDLDVTFVGGDMVTLFNEFHIPGVHSVPLSEEHPTASQALMDLRRRLCTLTQRPVNLQATTSFVQYLRDVVMDQPYLILLKKSPPDESVAAESPAA